jgi:hypothetical protein
MTPEERQSSLAAARRACEWLRDSIAVYGECREALDCLIAEFTRLDTSEQKRTSRAGRPLLPHPGKKTLHQRLYRKRKEKQ